MKAVLLTSFFLILFFWLLRFIGIFRRSALSLRTLDSFFALKIAFGFILFLIYSHYYPYRNTSDAFKYFDDSQVVYSTLYSDPAAFAKIVTGIDGDDPALDKYYSQMETWYRDKTYSSWNDNRTIVRINAFFSLFSGGVYYVHILFFCFLSFTGLVMLHTFITKFSPSHSDFAALLIFLPPSVLFWSSGVLKEAVVLFALGGFLLNISGSVEKKSIRHAAYTFIFLLMLVLLKVYVLVCLLPALLFWIGSAYSKKESLKYSSILFIALGLLTFTYLNTDSGKEKLLTVTEKQKDFINISRGGAYLISCHQGDTIYIDAETQLNLATKDSAHFTLKAPSTYHHWTYWKILDTVQLNRDDTTCYTIYGIFGKTGSSFHLTELRPEVTSFLKVLPEALVNTFFRPFPGEINSALIALAFLENLSFLVLVAIFILHYRKPRFKAMCFIIGTLVFALLLGAIVGYVTPVTGAIVRYRIPVIPFVLTSFLFLSDDDRLRRTFPFVRRLNRK